MTEPMCWNCVDAMVADGHDDDWIKEFAFQSRGPNEDCFCDVCFYGTRAAWLAGRESASDDLAKKSELLSYSERLREKAEADRDRALYLLRQAFGYQHLGWAQDGTWPRLTEEFLRDTGAWPSGATRVM